LYGSGVFPKAAVLFPILRQAAWGATFCAWMQRTSAKDD
jgi:hypothetical protein